MKVPLRVLVLCTGNSARSQMADIMLNELGRGRIVADSAGSRPAAQVNPLATETLAAFGFPAPRHAPQSIDAALDRTWDAVITVCDNARDACPVFPGATMMAHWGMPDPAEAEGTPDEKRAAFRTAFLELKGKVERVAALPLESIAPDALKAELRRIGGAA